MKLSSHRKHLNHDPANKKKNKAILDFSFGLGFVRFSSIRLYVLQNQKIDIINKYNLLFI